MTSWQGPQQGEPIDPNAAGVQPGYGYAPPPGYGYAPPGYGYPQQPAYPPYGYPIPPRDVRPGLATASAVLAFVNAGLLILAGVLLFLGGAIANDVEDSFDSGTHIGLELALDGVVNLVAGGLLIAGGVMLQGRNPNGRTLLAVAGGIVAAAAVYWLVRFGDVSSDSWVFDAAVFVVLTVLSLSFAWSSSVTRWLRRSG